MLQVSDLHVEFPTPRGTLHAVDGASFAVDAGDVFGIVGESGSGKSMTLRAIVGLLPTPGRIVSGAIVYNGIDLTSASRGALRRLRGREVSMVFQDPMSALNPVARVGDQIAEGPMTRLKYSRRKSWLRAVELMRTVGIPDAERRARAYPHEFSGGMRQRVMIAIALSSDPKVVLCDEPTTALDVTVQDQILKLLLSLQESAGLTVVIVTHDLAVVAETCRNLAVMYAGQVVETGPVDRIFREPRHPYTLALLRSVPRFEGLRVPLVSVPGMPPNLVAPPTGCRFHPRCGFAREDCVNGDFPLSDLGRGRATACIHHEEAAASAHAEPVVRDV